VGEISVHVYGLTVLKALKPLPVVKRMQMENLMHLPIQNNDTVVVM
jgi:hypothetical protein